MNRSGFGFQKLAVSLRSPSFRSLKPRNEVSRQVRHLKVQAALNQAAFLVSKIFAFLAFNSLFVFFVTFCKKIRAFLCSTYVFYAFFAVKSLLIGAGKASSSLEWRLDFKAT